MMCAKRPPPPPQFLLPRGCAAPTVRFSTSRHVAHDAESGHPDISRPLIRYMITARQPVRFRLPEQYRLPAARPSDDGFVPPNGTVGQWRPNAESGRPDTPPDEPRPLIRSASRPRPPKLAAGLSDHNSFLPPNDGVRKWLVDAEMASASASASSNAPSPAAGAPDDMAASNADESNGHTVLVLNAASKNLAETDFYRIARQGRHVDGWATGLVKGIHMHAPTSHHCLQETKRQRLYADLLPPHQSSKPANLLPMSPWANISSFSNSAPPPSNTSKTPGVCTNKRGPPCPWSGALPPIVRIHSKVPGHI